MADNPLLRCCCAFANANGANQLGLPGDKNLRGARPAAYLTPNWKIVVLFQIFPGSKIVLGNAGWFGESG